MDHYKSMPLECDSYILPFKLELERGQSRGATPTQDAPASEIKNAAACEKEKYVSTIDRLLSCNHQPTNLTVDWTKDATWFVQKIDELKSDSVFRPAGLGITIRG